MNFWVIALVLIGLLIFGQTETFVNRGFGLKFNGIGCWSNFYHSRQREQFSGCHKSPGKFDTKRRLLPYNWANDCPKHSAQYTGMTWCVDPEVHGCEYNTKRIDCQCREGPKCQCHYIQPRNWPGWEGLFGSPASYIEGFQNTPINQIDIEVPQAPKSELIKELEKREVTPKLVELVRKIRAQSADITRHPEFPKLVRLDKIKPC